MIKSLEDAERLRDFAMLLGWTEISILDYRLPEFTTYIVSGFAPDTAGERFLEDVPEYYTDWGAASALMFKYKVSIDFDPAQKFVSAGIANKLKYATLYYEQTDEHIRTAACRSIVCAVAQLLRMREYRGGSPLRLKPEKEQQ